MRLVVVRHGTAKSKSAWKGRDQERALTASGLRQARAVSARLARYRPDRVISSPSLRCKETVEPLASALGLRLERSDLLGTDQTKTAIDLVRRLAAGAPPSSTIVICTHREVIVEVLPALALQFGLLLPHRLPGAKGSCWMLAFRDSRLRQIRYWRPEG